MAHGVSRNRLVKQDIFSDIFSDPNAVRNVEGKPNPLAQARTKENRNRRFLWRLIGVS